jgi:hypothetical protein
MVRRVCMPSCARRTGFVSAASVSLGRPFTAARPNELWLADITYVPT